VHAYQRVQPLTIGELWAVPDFAAHRNDRETCVPALFRGAWSARRWRAKGADAFVDELGRRDWVRDPADLIERAIRNLSSVTLWPAFRRAVGAAPCVYQAAGYDSVARMAPS